MANAIEYAIKHVPLRSIGLGPHGNLALTCRYTKYGGGYRPDSTAVELFWKVQQCFFCLLLSKKTCRHSATLDFWPGSPFCPCKSGWCFKCPGMIWVGLCLSLRVFRVLPGIWVLSQSYFFRKSSCLACTETCEHWCTFSVDALVSHLMQVVSELGPSERELLLKFVTSSSRAPLGGFKYMQPPFTIHKVRFRQLSICMLQQWLLTT